MSFFQPPHGSSGSRTIYTVLHERAQNRDNDKYDSEDSSKQYNDVMHSPTPSDSIFSSQSESSRASPSPSSTDSSQSSKYAALPNDDIDHFMDFDATDACQLDAFVPASLRRAIDAAKYSSLGDFGTGICWEALPPIFALPNTKRPATCLEDMDIPLLSELSREQRRIVLEFLSHYRNCTAGIDQVSQVVAKANLPSYFVAYYLCLI